MAALTPKVDFASLSLIEMAQIALNAAEAAFKDAQAQGLVTDDSLAISIWMVSEVESEELRRRLIGADAEKFVENIDPETGKLATVLTYLMDSCVAYEAYGNEIPEGPQRWTGGAYLLARVQTAKKGWRHQGFACAASGVQGKFDAVFGGVAVRVMDALWSLKMLALYGKPEA
jgi:hypothetical protein